jgi:archaemetzincin
MKRFFILLSALMVSFSTYTEPKKTIIIVQPFKGFPVEYTQYVTKELKKIYPLVEIKEAIPIPENCRNSTNTRYRADKLIYYLNNRTKEGYCTIGLTNKDISATKEPYADWGIMGLGYCPGKACIASTFRVKGNDKLEKLFKLSIHELGHTQGLLHCPNIGCFMQDAKGKDKFREEHDFCKNCKTKLIKAGWKLEL